MILVQKLKYFRSLLWGKIGQETYFRDIPDIKETFLDYKNKLEKKSKNSNYAQKLEIFNSQFVLMYNKLKF